MLTECTLRPSGTFLILASCLACLVSSDSLAAESDNPVGEAQQQVKSIVPQVMSEMRHGAFEGAWQDYLQAFKLALSHTEIAETFMIQCFAHSCPSLGEVGWLVGKPASEAAIFEGTFASEDKDAQGEVWKEYLRNLSRSDYLEEVPRFAAEPPERVKLLDSNFAHGDTRPWVSVHTDGGLPELAALISTGAVYGSLMDEQIVLERDLQYRPFGDQITNRDLEGSEYLVQQTVMSGVRVGEYGVGTIPVSVIDNDDPPRAPLTIGMHPLLRYGSVCFDWSGRTLHLGELGPCSKASGLSLRVELDVWNLIPTKRIDRTSNRSVVVTFDTGSTHNRCKASLSDALAGNALELDREGLISASCVNGTRPIREGFPIDMVIGMEALGEFAAFGWELDPLRLYLVANKDQDGT